MSSDDGTSEETGSTTNRPEKFDTDRTLDPDLDISYDEAQDRDDFVYAEVYTTEGQPEDADKGMLRMDYDVASVDYALMVRGGETGTTKIKERTITKIDFGRAEDRAENDGLL